MAAQFGLSGTYTSLVSERDLNFRMTTAAGERYVVKIVSSVEEPARTDFQIAGLLHLEAAGLAWVPRIVRTLAGEGYGCVDYDGADYRLRIVTYLEGTLLQHGGISPALARDFGQRLAELDLALKDFSHAGESQDLIWDMQRAADMRTLMRYIADEPLRASVDSILQTFESHVSPLLAQLRQQVIHNDANTENVLVDDSGTVSGTIDFSDMRRAPLIVEVAIAAAYLRPDSDDPTQLIAPFVGGFHAKCPLDDQQIDLLFDLVQTRVAMTIAMLFWRLDVRDADDRYRQKTLQVEGGAMRFLQALQSQGREVFLQRIRQELKSC